MLYLPDYSNLQTLYQGNNSIIYRALRQYDRTLVVLKTQVSEYPAPEEIARIRHEYNILNNLNFEGIVKSIDLIHQEYRLILILEYFNPLSLKQHITDSLIAIPQFLNIAIQLSDTLDKIHQQQIIHKDIKPHNILIDPSTQETKIIDFSIATRLKTETQTIINPNYIEGTLAYISPEQTGRMNRCIDYRSDFYSLGVTFYQILTKQLPFYSNDPMEVIHSHIAKTPIPPNQINSKIPIAISLIVMKLLSKNAEDRYQSALGLKADLEYCLTKLQTINRIQVFTPGKKDKKGQFSIPQKLYGRKTEVSLLLEAFGRVSNTDDDSISQCNKEIILVTGYSGIGKTKVVNEVHKPIVKARGYFIGGKFDQFKRDIPYAAISQAFQQLIRQLLTETTLKVSEWKQKLLTALGENSQIIIDVIPELELIIGKQGKVAQLGATESQNRFNQLFGKFVRVFAQLEHPLVLFLDDLQWADLASLNLIEQLMTDSETQHLLFIGAYRDNEVNPVHPTIQTIEKIKKTSTTVNQIILKPLKINYIRQLVAETLAEEITTTNERLTQLSDLLYSKTQGNPFFLTQLLKTLYTDKLLTFDFTVGFWMWDIEQIQSVGIADLGVVELIARNIEKLSTTTQKVLKLAACIGNKFSLDVLAVVNEKSSTQTAKDLWSALQTGLILPLTQDYKIPLLFSENDNSRELLFDESRVSYRFLHDRVQQAAYSIIPEENRKKIHLKIGKLLWKSLPSEQIEENIFDLVNQLNIGRDFITETELQEGLLKLNLWAGKKAKGATAYEAAGRYLNVGLELLPTNSWESNYELTRDVYFEILEVEYLNVNFESAQQLSELLLSKIQSNLEQVKVYELQIPYYYSQNQSQPAIDIALLALKYLGAHLPAKPNKVNILVELAKTKLALSHKKIEDLANIAIMNDSERIATMRLLMAMIPAAFNANPALFPLAVFKMVRISLKYGKSHLSAFGYVNYGLILCGVLGDFNSGYQFGQLALDLLDQLNAREIKAKVYFAFNNFIRHWKEHLQETINSLLEGFQSGLSVGDLEFASYCLCFYTNNKFWVGEHLDTVDQTQKQSIDVIFKYKQKLVGDHLTTWNQLVSMLKAEVQATDDLLKLGEKLSVLKQANDSRGIINIYLSQLIYFYLWKNYVAALEKVGAMAEYLEGMKGSIEIVQYNFYYSLSLLGNYPSVSAKEQKQYLKQVKSNQKQMKTWAQHAPMNFQHKYDLIAAEIARVLGENETAATYYEKAISGASENNYIHEEAIANERAAEFYLSIAREKVAKTYMTEAYYCYISWGATGKIKNLEERHSNLIIRTQTPEMPKIDVTTTISSITNTTSKNLDFYTIIKASQTISEEIELNSLLDKLMQILMENAGANKGTLVLNNSGNWEIPIQCLSGGYDSCITSVSQINLPHTVINTVKQTQKTVLINELETETTFAGDPYLIEHQPKSLLCTPIIKQGKFIALLLLENSLATGAFTPDRIKVLHLLMTQAAISIENARLYQGLENHSYNLETQVKQRTHALQEKNQDLEQTLFQLQQTQTQLIQTEKMSALGEMVGGIAHEINNPITFISSNIIHARKYFQDLLELLELYQQNSPEPSPAITEKLEELELEFLSEDVEKLFNSMEKGSGRISQIILGLRNFSRLDESDMKEVDIHEGLENTLMILQHRLKAERSRREIAIIKKYGKLPPVYCWASQLNQVFMHILSNAIDALTTSRIESCPEITITTEVRDAKTVIIRIADNGVGMSDRVCQRVFEPFFSTKQIGLGTGLGLFVSYQIVTQQHGGKLKCISQLGQGTEFIIEIPIEG
ncbi:MAG: AAA family ATPase [Okeania sp. SIO2C9]|uniref:trifunctional serine/threonine-protein kinase/ATP-binding protein/sensor histidine kinase n=1 Tax=Okeania sp. SIO2C9 TaxID=2607791 RepID=UPI0013C246C3|nr:ATP-binding sensor histidine kinase [Okeania sp. SIO2C9]NEQ72857.1 AAA family ATPase [Okeania sp. SIO2C9]